MRFLALVVLTIVFYSCSTQKSRGQSNSYRSERIEIKSVSKQVYQHISYLSTESFGRVPCNGMIIVDHNEAIVFDTPVDDKSSEELIKWIKNSLNCRIKAVIPTHFHDDCLGGLNTFHAYGIPSYANELTIALAKAHNQPVPKIGFSHTKHLTVGTSRVILGYFGEGHTRDNIVGYFPKEDVMFGGCLIKEFGADKGNLSDANTSDWASTVRKLKATYPGVKIIIPGHGKTGGNELLDYTIDMFKSSATKPLEN